MKMSSSPQERMWGHVHPDTRHVTARCCHQKLAGANFSPPCDFKSPEDISLATIWRNIQNQIEINRFLFFKKVLTFSLLLRQRFEFLDARPAELSLVTCILNKIFSLFSRIPLENGTFRQFFREPNIILIVIITGVIAVIIIIVRFDLGWVVHLNSVLKDVNV